MDRLLCAQLSRMATTKCPLPMSASQLLQLMVGYARLSFNNIRVIVVNSKSLD